MSELAISLVDNYLTSINKGDKKFDIHIDNLCICVQTCMTEYEKEKFVSEVIRKSYVDGIRYSSVKNRNAFIEMFVKMLTNFPIPLNNEGTCDIDKLCYIVNEISLFNRVLCNQSLEELHNELKTYIKEEIDFKNQKIIAMYSSSEKDSEVLDTVAELSNRLLAGVNKVCDILDDVKKMTAERKFSELVQSENLEKIADLAQQFKLI